jgi:peptidoglycan/LPS O-acetylase OafA/YrhL
VSPRWLWHRYGETLAPRLAHARHWTRFGAYTLITLAGVAAIVYPPQSVRTTAGDHSATLAWAGLMALSAAACAVGAASNSWVGEYIGLIPLAATVLVFAVSALEPRHRGVGRWPVPARLPGAFMARWQEVALQRYDAQRAAPDRGDGDGDR